jgi:hypothetical protein
LLTFAHSISFRAVAILRPGVTGRVLVSFERVCDLVTDGGEVVVLVWGGIGNGPLNVVLEGRPGAALPACVRFAAGERLLTVGGMTFDLTRAELWDARPDWDALLPRRAQILAAADIARQSIAGLSERSLFKQAGSEVEAIREAGQIATDTDRHIVCVASVCGTEADSQTISQQEAKLRDAGVIVLPDNAAAARLAGLITQALHG